jgi:hypothetical protein
MIVGMSPSTASSVLISIFLSLALEFLIYARALEAIAYAVAIVGGIAGAVMRFQNVRKESIEITRKVIVCAWTNEGNIASNRLVGSLLVVAWQGRVILQHVFANRKKGLLLPPMKLWTP